MKSRNIIIIAALAGTLLGCVHPHYPSNPSMPSYPDADSKPDTDSTPEIALNPAKVLIGTWDQVCNEKNSQIKFDSITVKRTQGGKTSTGTWAVNAQNKLFLEYNGKKREKWTIQHLEKFEYTITKGKMTCQGYKTAG